MSPYPAGIAVDSTRAVPEGLFLLHDSRKSCVLSRKLCIVFATVTCLAVRIFHTSSSRTLRLILYLSTLCETGVVCLRTVNYYANLISQVRRQDRACGPEKSTCAIVCRFSRYLYVTASHFCVACRRSRIPARATVICFTRYRASETIIAKEGNREGTGGPARGREWR